MNIERLEWPRLVQFADLFDGHTDILLRPISPNNKAANLAAAASQTDVCLLPPALIPAIHPQRHRQLFEPLGIAVARTMHVLSLGQEFHLVVAPHAKPAEHRFIGG